MRIWDALSQSAERERPKAGKPEDRGQKSEVGDQRTEGKDFELWIAKLLLDTGYNSSDKRIASATSRMDLRESMLRFWIHR